MRKEEEENKKKSLLAWIIGQKKKESEFKLELIKNGINPELVPYKGKYLKMTNTEAELFKKVQHMKTALWCSNKDKIKNLPKFGVLDD